MKQFFLMPAVLALTLLVAGRASAADEPVPTR